MAKPFPSINTFKESLLNGNGEDNYKFYIQEKVDGSQLSLYLKDNDVVFFNKSGIVKSSFVTFSGPVNMIPLIKHKLNPNYTYHGESICKIKHNSIAYGRTPKYYFILYDIFDRQTNIFLNHEQLKQEADRIGLETVQLLYMNNDQQTDPVNKCKELIALIENGDLESCLGGRIEGIVLKNPLFVDKKGNKVPLMLKLVTKEFKERINKPTPKATRTNEEFLEFLGSQFACEARFKKAVQHLLDKNQEINMNSLINELDSDLEKEYLDEIKINLYVEMSPSIKKSARYGVREYIESKKIPQLPQFNEYGHKFVNEERYARTYSPDIHIMSSNLDDDFEEKYRNETIEYLYNKHNNVVKGYSRKGLDKFYELIKCV
jgi:hypothetical protein